MVNSNKYVSQEILESVAAKLAIIEDVEGVQVLFAVESGSRAWGFPSTDSDYDVRLVYVHPPSWYLSVDLEQRRDVIERPLEENIDLNGWDIRKALRLFAKSNPPLLEWVNSPIVYHDACGFRARLRELLPLFYSPNASAYHYLHMAEGNYRQYLRGSEVWVKKYFYVLRPLLAILWIEQGRGPVPMEFARLLDTISDRGELVVEIRALLERKMQGEELDKGPAIPAISEFIELELLRLATYKPPKQSAGAGWEPLNTLFRETLVTAWPTK